MLNNGVKSLMCTIFPFPIIVKFIHDCFIDLYFRLLKETHGALEQAQNFVEGASTVGINTKRLPYCVACEALQHLGIDHFFIVCPSVFARGYILGSLQVEMCLVGYFLTVGYAQQSNSIKHAQMLLFDLLIIFSQISQ